MNDDDFTKLKSAIRRTVGIDLDYYKDQQMRRRLDGLISSQGLDVPGYSSLISQDQAALQRLRDFITINVTEFFRDAHQYEVLRKRILPRILETTPQLNIWSAGCSIGSEPYSLAILLQELTPERRHRILATDFDRTALRRAQAGGPYHQSEMKTTPRWMILKYFTRSADDYYGNDSIRERVQFKQQDLLADRFEGSFDLIAYRNVVIYFSDATKKMLDGKFHQALKPGGWLFMGGSETMLSAKELGFIRAEASFYQKSDERSARDRSDRFSARKA